MTDLSRRKFVQLCLAALPAPAVIALLGREALGGNTLAQTPRPTATKPDFVQTLVPTPACGDDDDDLDTTLSMTEGPFYTPNNPERTSFLEAGITGTAMVVTGLVLGTDCQPLAGALVDFWHCDDKGVYDNVGFKLRGHQFTDENGQYYLETIIPGLYPGRTRHFHVKVQAPYQPVLTTQLFFPDEPDNARDGIFDESLLLALHETDETPVGTFNFVLAVS